MTSIVFDILERVEEGRGSDEEALRFHLEDVVDEERERGGVVRVWSGLGGGGSSEGGSVEGVGDREAERVVARGLP